MESYDVIVVGAGFNGLSAAAYLARAGLKVVAVEKRDTPAGRLASGELYPGFTTACLSPSAFPFPRELVAALDLPHHGLRLLPFLGALHLGEGQSHAFYPDDDMRWRETVRYSPRDAETWYRFSNDIARFRKMRAALATLPMLPIRGLLRWPWGANKALQKHFIDFSCEALHEYLRFTGSAVADTIAEYFDSPLLQTQLAALALMEGGWGPHSSLSSGLLLERFCESRTGMALTWCQPRGGARALAHALTASLQAAGGKLDCAAEVTDFIVRDKKVVGVVLTGGREIYASYVVSSLDVKRTFLTLFSPGDLPRPLAEAAISARTTGQLAVLRLALDRAPELQNVNWDCPALKGPITLVESIQSIHDAYVVCKDGRLAAELPLTLFVPSLQDPTLAPPGCHVAILTASCVPYRRFDGLWTAVRRDELANRLLSQLSKYWPDARQHILAKDLWVPADFEDRFGIAGGDVAGRQTSRPLMIDDIFAGGPLRDNAMPNLYLIYGDDAGRAMPGMAGIRAAKSLLAYHGAKARNRS
jgi:phytoene dehydrogenase-like protein